jgi:hypothetical protein
MTDAPNEKCASFAAASFGEFAFAAGTGLFSPGGFGFACFCDDCFLWRLAGFGASFFGGEWWIFDEGELEFAFEG